MGFMLRHDFNDVDKLVLNPAILNKSNNLMKAEWGSDEDWCD